MIVSKDMLQGERFILFNIGRPSSQPPLKKILAISVLLSPMAWLHAGAMGGL